MSKRTRVIVHKQVAIHPQAVENACAYWNLNPGQALDEIARIFQTGYFDKHDKQSLLDILTLDRPETSRRIVVSRELIVAGAAVGLPTAQKLKRRAARRLSRIKEREELMRQKEEAAKAAARVSGRVDFFSVVRAGLRFPEDVPEYRRREYVRFSAFAIIGEERQEVSGFLCRFSEVGRMFEVMRATRSALPLEQQPGIILEALGQCGNDWLCYHMEDKGVEKRGKIRGEYANTSESGSL